MSTPPNGPVESPFGAHLTAEGTRFTVWSAHAESIELCLFSGAATGPERRLPMKRAGGVWQTVVPGLSAGQAYGYRAHGPWEPSRGHRFNPAKLLIDPYAAALAPADGPIGSWNPALLGSETSGGRERPDPVDSAPWAPRSLVVDRGYDWTDAPRPRASWSETVIYEAHVKGLTARHSEIEAQLRGTYLGLIEPPMLRHLADLGITAVQLMPVLQFLPERHLAEHGRINYWGYSPIAWQAPHAGYAAPGRGDVCSQFKAMVDGLHAAGFEVLLDVVFNHSAEGGADGPTLSLRGLDNASYYRLTDHGQYVDWTGCGNTLDCESQAVRQLIVDSLVRWADEYRIDGFRFDLAPALGREGAEFKPDSPLLGSIADEPRLQSSKLIAEPWDLGPSGYSRGRFPRPWREWDDLFRDAARAAWRSDGPRPDQLVTLLDQDREAAADPRDSSATHWIRYVACHDGMTLADLVSYSQKKNHANGHQNQDGAGDEGSSNWGVEGPSAEPGVQRARRRAQRGMLATLFLVPGVPMIGHGDEGGRSQLGNNNPYCLDDATTWVDWTDGSNRSLLPFIRRLIELRHELEVHNPRDLSVRSDPRRALTRWAWTLGPVGSAAPQRAIVYVNSGDRPVIARLPRVADGRPWRLLLSTHRESTLGRDVGPSLRVPGRTLLTVAGTGT